MPAEKRKNGNQFDNIDSSVCAADVRREYPVAVDSKKAREVYFDIIIAFILNICSLID